MECLPYIESADYWYLQEDFRGSDAWIVVFRGLQTGVYLDW